MDLSNKDEAKYWFEQARKVKDKELRRIAVQACKHYQKLSRNQEKLEAKWSKPGYGFRSLLGFFCVVALLVIWSLLAFAKAFSVTALVAAGGVVIALMVVGSAFASHATGRLSDDSLIRLVQLGIQKAMPQKGNSEEAPTIEGDTGSTSNKNPALPPPTGTPSLPAQKEPEE